MKTDHLSFFKKLWSRLCGQCLNTPSRRRRIARVGSAELFGVSAQLEVLEQRTFLSSASVLNILYAQPAYELQNTANPNANSTANPSGLTPAKIATAYGFNGVSNNGAGQTIAIVDAYDDPTILNDLKAFDKAFGLPDPPSMKVMSQAGSTTSLPSTDPAKSWEEEESLDVEWAHALAPGANIVLVEANSAGYSDLVTAVQTAAGLPGVSVVSMSWGGSQFAVEAMYDSYFTTPTGHQGVTFVASTGDIGAPGEFPASSSNVLAVGGTSLTVDGSGNYVSESGWSGSGGGVSAYESQPSYQKGVVTQSTTMRTIPDVSFDANPNSGVPIYDSFTYGTTAPWSQVGGTSFSCPSWGSIIAIVNQGRVQNGLGTLNGASQTLPLLYQLDKSNPGAFHDITTGNNGNAAGAGYDLVTGMGSPVVSQIYSGLTGSTSSAASKLVIQQSPTSGTAGTKLGTLTIAVENQSSQVVTTDNSTVTLSIGSGPGGFAAGSTISVQAVNGIATFTNLTLNSAGSYTISASDGSLTSATTSAITVNAAPAAKVVFQQVPTTGTAGAALQTVKVLVEDQFGNIVTADSSTVTISVASGSGSFASTSTTSVAAVNGIATFTNLVLDAAASYTLKASDGSLASAISAAINVNATGAYRVVFQTVPHTGIAGTTLQGMTVLVEDQFGNIVTTDNSTVTLSVASGVGGFSTNSTTSVSAVNGVATFSNLTLDMTGSYTLRATDGSLASGLTSAITIAAAQGSKLVFQQVPSTGTANAALAPVIVAVEDQYGNVVATDNSNVTLAIASGAGGFSSSSILSVSAVNGIATFTNLSLDVAGSYTFTAVDGNLPTGTSSTLTVGASNAAKVVFEQSPSSGVAGGTLTGVTVEVEDQFGNVVTTDNSVVTISVATGPGSLSSSSLISASTVNGIATFSNLMLDIAGAYTLNASDGSLTNGQSSAFGISAGQASQVVFQQLPATATAGTPLAPVVAAVEDQYGNIVTTDNSSVALSVSSGAGGFAPGSLTTVTAVNGIATFTNLALDVASAYTFTTSDGSLPGAASSAVEVNAAAAARVVFLQIPATGTAGTAIQSVVVAIEDQYGNIVTTDNSNVTISVANGAAGFSSDSTTTATVVNGIATFANLVLDVAGSYTLTASDGSLTNGTSNGANGSTVNTDGDGFANFASAAITMNAAQAVQLVFEQAPTAGCAGSTLQPITVLVEDQYGNVVTADNSAVTISVGSGSGSFSSDSITTVTAVNGIATFTNLTLDVAGSYTLSASDGALPIATSSAISISAAQAAQVVFLQVPVTGTSNNTLQQIIVGVEDQYGNLLTADNSTVTISVASGTGNFLSNSVTSVSVVNGIATFTNLALSSAGSYTLTANDGNLTSAMSSAITVSATQAAKLVFQQPPATGTAGSTLQPVTVLVEDKYGNLLTGDSSTVTLTLNTGAFANGATTISVQAVNGIATFNGLTINTSGNYKLIATDGTVNQVTSPTFAISAAAASQLVFVQNPPTAATAGVAFSPFVKLSVEDQYGNVVNSDTSSITLTLNGGTFSTGSNTMTASVINGFASFYVQINKAGTYSLGASDGALAGATSGSISITPASASKLALQQAPTTGSAGATLQTVTVAVEDKFGNIIATDNSTVTLTLNSGTFSDGSSSETATVVNGIATFSGLTINKSGSWKLIATDGALTQVTSANVVVSPAAASQVVFVQAPPTTATAGSTFSPVVKVAVEDQYGNIVTTDNSSITLTLNGGTFSTGVSSMMATANNGAASFVMAINKAGVYSLTVSDGSLSGTSANITVNPAAAAKLVLQQAPSTGTAGTALQTVTVAVEDKFGNVITTDNSTVTLTLNNGTFWDGSTMETAMVVNGIATFSGLAINKSGNFKLIATDGALTQITSPNIVISPAMASQVVFVQAPPTTATAGVAFSPFVKVAVEDQYGNVVTSDTSSITLTLNGGNFSTGSNTISASAINGAASFYLQINKAGTYSLTASDGTLGNTTSGSITVTPAAASKLAFLQVPTTGVAGATLQTVIVAVEDKFGNIITSDNSTLTLTLSSGTFSDGNTAETVNVVNGIATFNGLAINKSGSYKLIAADGTLTAVTSSNVVITNG